MAGERRRNEQRAIRGPKFRGVTQKIICIHRFEKAENDHDINLFS
jgi:hypothetical protein